MKSKIAIGALLLLTALFWLAPEARLDSVV